MVLEMELHICAFKLICIIRSLSCNNISCGFGMHEAGFDNIGSTISKDSIFGMHETGFD